VLPANVPLVLVIGPPDVTVVRPVDDTVPKFTGADVVTVIVPEPVVALIKPKVAVLPVDEPNDTGELLVLICMFPGRFAAVATVETEPAADAELVVVIVKLPDTLIESPA